MATSSSERDKILAMIEERLGKLKKSGMGGNLSNNLWKVPENETTIRMLPMEGMLDPFVELYFHYQIGKVNQVLCPFKSVGLPESYDCPICDFANSLYADKDKVTDETKKIYTRIKAKLRVFSPIVVRGEEFNESGEPQVKLWGYSPTLYEEMMKTAIDPDFELFWMTEDGVDIRVTKTKADKPGEFDKISIRPRAAKTKLAKTKQETDALLAAIPKISECFKLHTKEEIGTILDNWIESGKTEEHESPSIPEDNTPIIQKDDTSDEDQSKIDDILKDIKKTVEKK